MTIATVSANEAQALIAQGARLIDIRAADEYAREHIPAARPRRLSCWLAVFRRGGRRGCR